MVTSEQKEKNKNHLLNNITDYMIDVRGNFADISEGCEWFDTDYFYIYRDNLTPEGYEEVTREIKRLRQDKADAEGYPTETESLNESILARIEDWELDLWTPRNGKFTRLEGIKSKSDGSRKISMEKLNCRYQTTGYMIIYKLGFKGLALGCSWESEEKLNEAIEFDSERWERSKQRIEKLKAIYQRESTQDQNNSTTTNPTNSNNTSTFSPDKPTNSPNINTDNSDVPDNDNKNFDTQQNDNKINQSKNNEEARENAKQIILNVFKKYNVKPDDLDKNLWKGKNSWEEHLEILTSKQEIAYFTESIRKKCEAKAITDSFQPVSGVNKPLVFLLIGFFFLIGIVAILVIRKKHYSKKL